MEQHPKPLSIPQAQARFAALVDEAVAGKEVIISDQHGRTVRLVPIRPPPPSAS
ncbi:type II toxin-antitoxin system prevent-host-death family antitoxin [Novosphingobium sp. fls2-241-R2A-195]|uniref:type II toxin-antitoxin system Phd/YefM family antitoxin n=1 Tax=Novosphingobium sp. fls2-241-R2A-195 TaxID=3040296 RepID=UPI0033064BB0